MGRERKRLEEEEEKLRKEEEIKQKDAAEAEAREARMAAIQKRIAEAEARRKAAEEKSNINRTQNIRFKEAKLAHVTREAQSTSQQLAQLQKEADALEKQSLADADNAELAQEAKQVRFHAEEAQKCREQLQQQVTLLESELEEMRK